MAISTVIYYYSATGNSLYTARALQELLPEVELRSIPEALAEDNPSVNADCVGFVFPMHYFGLPLQVGKRYRHREVKAAELLPRGGSA